MFASSKPKVSVCIPVCGTERYLDSCLESVAAQDFEAIEIIVVDDGGEEAFSPEEDALQAGQIVKAFKKRNKKRVSSVKFIKHGKNRGLVEARRSALYAAEGSYVMFVDSDDFLPPGAVRALFDVAEKTGADIVHGRTKVCMEGSVESGIASQALNESFPLLKKRAEEMDFKANRVFEGGLNGRRIFDEFLVETNICGFLWGKIFTRSLCLEAFSKIPPVFCTFGEDFLTFFFLSLFAQRYEGIEACVYCYNADTGISSNRTISSLAEWEKVCSTASVFTVLFNWIEDEASAAPSSSGQESLPAAELTEEETDKVRQMCRWYAANNLAQLDNAVDMRLREEAYRMLCDYWGVKMINSVKA